MQTTRRQIISGAAAATVLASAPHANASTKALSGPDARLDQLYREWREAEDAFGEACKVEDEADHAASFPGIEVEGPDGKVQACKSESEVRRLFPEPFAVTDLSDNDFATFMVAARGRATEEKERVMAEIWSRYPDVHAEAREQALERLKKAERAHRKSPAVKAHKQAEAAWQAASDRVDAVLDAIADTPAVSLQGVLTKFRIWAEDGGDGRTSIEAVKGSAFADLRRLAGEV